MTGEWGVETSLVLHQHEVINGAKRRDDVSITKDNEIHLSIHFR